MITQEKTLIITDEEILGGIPVFAGTRVPVETLFDYLEGGHPLDDFLDGFPTVSRPQARDVLTMVKRNLVERAAVWHERAMLRTVRVTESDNY